MFIGMNADKLAKLQAQVRIGGKGTPRRKMKKALKPTVADDKRIQSQLKKLNAQSIPGVEEVNLFKQNGRVIHFSNPKVQVGIASGIFAVTGKGEEKELTELVPGILTQLGPDSINTLKMIAESYQKSQGAGKGDEAPQLVDNFEAIAEASA